MILTGAEVVFDSFELLPDVILSESLVFTIGTVLLDTSGELTVGTVVAFY